MAGADFVYDCKAGYRLKITDKNIKDWEHLDIQVGDWVTQSK